MKKSYHSMLAAARPVNAGFNEPSVLSMHPPTGRTCGPTGLQSANVAGKAPSALKPFAAVILLRREALHQIDEAGLQKGLRSMAAVLDDPAPGDHYVANRGSSARENEMIEGVVRDGTGHAGILAVKDQPIRPSTHLDGSGRLADRLCASPRGLTP